MIHIEDIKTFHIKSKYKIGCIAAIDFGTKKIGVAIADSSNTIAFGYSTLKNDQHISDHIVELIQAKHIKAIVIGYPKTLDNKLHPLIREIMNFVDEVIKKLDIDILLWDERMSTRGAIRNINTLPKWNNKQQKKPRNFGRHEREIAKSDDHHAAAYILQEVLDIIKRLDTENLYDGSK